MKTTPWFKCGEHDSVHNGWYEVQYAGCRAIDMRYWYRGDWRCSENMVTSMFGMHHQDRWRGLTEKPNASR